MPLDVVLTTPLTQALHSAILPKLVEVGWSTGVDDDAALAEYIILMLTSNKTQEEIASELSGDLLNLGPDDPGARDFAQWLSEQVGVLNAQLSGGDGYQGVQSGVAQDNSTTEAQDAEMGDASESVEPNVPTGPKSMRNGGMPGSRGNPRDKRMLGHLAKAMDRTNESVLHRVRPQVGNERINSHRAPPTGPRQQTQIRGAASRMQNGRGQGPMRPGNAVANILNMTPEQQMSMFALYEQQAQVLAQMFTPEQMAEAARVASMSAGNPSMNNFAQNNRQSRSLFDRVQPSQRQNGFRNNQNNHHVESSAYNESPSSSMDVQMSQEKSEPSPDTPCRFNLSCTNKDCKFAHQSPAAPLGTTIDVSDVCAFGAACKNRKCVGRHPSPAQKTAHQTELDCKFYPNCTNSRCPFRHPSMPLCRNGADCTTPDCKFTHVKTLCKFNPCLNPTCTFKHVEGQKRGKFEDKIWVADGAKHVSERKFVDDEDKPEELIIPGGGGDGVSQASSATAELIA